jgi:hypothetical protein
MDLKLTLPGPLTFEMNTFASFSVLTTTASRESEVPGRFSLEQNYPNPFNPSTTIRFSLARSGYATLRIFNTLGEVVASPVTESLPAGIHEIEWDTSGFPSGVYFCSLSAGESRLVRRMLLLR